MSGRASKERTAPACGSPISVRITSDILFAAYLALLLKLTVFRAGFSLDSFMLGGSLGNIAAFIPLGAYLAYRTKMRMVSLVLIGAAVSIAIEALQFAFDVGVTEIDDVILNTAGTLIGAVAIRGINRLTAKSTKK